MSDERPLPPFPVDDFTLTAVEHALGAVLSYPVDDPGSGPVVLGAEFSMGRLLDFMSGYDPAKSVGTEHPLIEEYQGQIYHRDDIIQALIAEVRRLRALVGEE